MQALNMPLEIRDAISAWGIGLVTGSTLARRGRVNHSRVLPSIQSHMA